METAVVVSLLAAKAVVIHPASACHLRFGTVRGAPRRISIHMGYNCQTLDQHGVFDTKEATRAHGALDGKTFQETDQEVAKRLVGAVSIPRLDPLILWEPDPVRIRQAAHLLSVARLESRHVPRTTHISRSQENATSFVRPQLAPSNGEPT